MNSRTPRRAPGGPLYTPGASATRRAVEGRSARVLLLLHHQPRWLVPGAVAALFIAGLAVGGPAGAALLAVQAVVLGWFAYLSWPAQAGQSRALRAAAIAVVLLLAVLQLSR